MKALLATPVDTFPVYLAEVKADNLIASIPAFVTGFEKWGHFAHFEMHMLQRCVFPQLNVLSKLNVGCLWKRC